MQLNPSIDFEFASGTDIKLGLERYFADPEARVLCMSLDMADGCDAALWVPGMPTTMLEPLFEHVRRGGKVRGWNVLFEWYCWNMFCVPLYGFPPLQLSQLEDSMAEAAAMNLPQSLGKCAIALGLPADQQKDKRGKELIKLLCCPQDEPVVKPREAYRREGDWKSANTRHRNWLAKGGRWLNDPALLQELYDYCRQDVVTEVAVSRKLRRLIAFEQQVWEHTQVINLRGVPIDCDEIRNVCAVVDAEIDRLNDELALLTDCSVGAGTERSALLAWVNERAPKRQVEIEIRDEGLDRVNEGLEDHDAPVRIVQQVRTEIVERDLLDDLQAETIDNLLADPRIELPADVRRVLQIRSAVSQTSTAKLHAMLRVVAADGTLKNMLVYHGASTGRDASRGGINLQNITRPRIEDVETAIALLITGDHDLAHAVFGDAVMDAAVAVIRSMIKAPEGYEFIDGDFSSVENRVGVWLADQLDKVEMFRQGLDEYKVFAATNLYKIAYAEVTKHQRQVSKSAVLGCLFGQGAAGLVEYAKGYGVFLTLAEAQDIVDAYRREYKRVKNLWYRCGDASIEAVRNPGVWVKAGSKLQLCCFKNFLWMKLPSGRLISWAAPLVENKKTPWGAMKDVVTVMQVDAVTKQWRRDKLIGSSIFQSGVQATARDLLMHGMFQVEQGGYAVVLRAHDELLSLVRKGFGSVEDFLARLCVNPPWALDLPLAGEGWRGQRFRK
jgi:DNA polymerase